MSANNVYSPQQFAQSIIPSSGGLDLGALRADLANRYGVQQQAPVSP